MTIKPIDQAGTMAPVGPVKAITAPVAPDMNTMDLIRSLQKPEYESNPAKWAYHKLAEDISKFELNLDQNHEVGVRLVTFGQALTFHVDDMGYHGPFFIIFYGTTDEGHPVQLIQHISQISLLLMSVEKQGNTPRRIGFDLINRPKEEKTENGKAIKDCPK